jgi:undecaprenyl diphosphate synthase
MAVRVDHGFSASGHAASEGARYVAIIADGNRRWARQNGLPVAAGHEAGVDTAWARLHDAIELGIRELTLFAFSTENWARPQEEVDGLFAMAARRIWIDTPGLCADGVRMRFIGRRDRLPADLVRRMRWAEALTAANRTLTLFLAFDYGGRSEIVQAARSCDASDEAAFRGRLYAPDMHDPDLMIRTGGQRRLSNYMLWQCAYSELVFQDDLWPNFGREAFASALAEFATRQRRFGGG